MRRWTTSQMWLLVVLIATCIMTAFIAGGYYSVQSCAIEYPHDGQCSMGIMADYLTAIVLALGTFVIGGIVIAEIKSRRKR